MPHRTRLAHGVSDCAATVRLLPPLSAEKIFFSALARRRSVGGMGPGFTLAKTCRMWRAARRGLSSAPSPCTYEGAPSQRTLLALKPDTVQRGLIGALLGRFEQRGFKVVALKMLQPSRELAESHYEEHRGKAFYERACTFIASGPLVAAVLEGRGVIGATRAMIGGTEPLECAPGTIRFDFGAHWRRNLVHGSDSETAAAREIPLWFRPEELCQWEHCASSWVYELPTARTRFDE